MLYLALSCKEYLALSFKEYLAQSCQTRIMLNLTSTYKSIMQLSQNVSIR